MAQKPLACYLFMPLSLLLISADAFADPINPISRDSYELHAIIFWLCVSIGIVVFSIMFYSLTKYRKSRSVEAVQFHINTKLEVIWSIVPFLIIVAMIVPATVVLMRMSNNVHVDANKSGVHYQKPFDQQQKQQDAQFNNSFSSKLHLQKINY